MTETRARHAITRSPMATLWLGLDQPAIGDGILLMRQAFGLTRQQLSDRMAEASDDADRVDLSLLFRWERGRGRRPRPSDGRRLLLARVCETELVRLNPLSRRTFLHRLTVLAGVPWLAGPLNELAQSEGALADWQLPGDAMEVWAPRRGQVTAATVEAIRELTRTFRRLDNQLGGGYAQALVAQHLDGQVLPMLRQGRYSETIGLELFAAAAELAHLAGWMAYDVELHVQARRYLNQALQLAASDPSFAGEVLAGLSHQALWLGHATESIDLAQAARQNATKARVPALMAEAYVMEAQGHARLGDAKYTATLLHRAEKALEPADQSSQPEWLRYFGEAYLAAKFGHTFRELGDWRQAARFARRSLDMEDGFVRGRAFNMTLLASVLVETDLDQACAIGLDVVELARGLQSARAIGYLQDLRRRLSAHENHPAVGAFNDRLAEVLG